MTLVSLLPLSRAALAAAAALLWATDKEEVFGFMPSTLTNPRSYRNNEGSGRGICFEVAAAQSEGDETVSASERAAPPTKSNNSTITLCSTASTTTKPTATAATAPLLGIDLASEFSLSLSESDRASLVQELKIMIDRRVEEGIVDLQLLHDKWERELNDGQLPLEQAMALNAIRESKAFSQRLDSIVGEFWNKTAVSRKKTHDLYRLDELEQQQKAKDEADQKAKKDGARKGGITFKKQSWKKTNDAWDDWDEDGDW